MPNGQLESAWIEGIHAKSTDTPDYRYDDSDHPRFEKIPADALYPCYYREGELSLACFPKKVYLQAQEDESHERLHSHSWDLECDGHAGKARILAAQANVLHESQDMKEERKASTDFVLVESTVGHDINNQDNLYENLP